MKETSKILVCIYIFLMYFIGIFIAFELTFWNILKLQNITFLNQVLFVVLLICIGYLAYLTNKYNELVKKNPQINKVEKDNIFSFNILLCVVNTFTFIVIFVLPGILISINNYQLIFRLIILTSFIVSFFINLGIIFDRLKIVFYSKPVTGIRT